jgi:hypothetical protein
MAVKGLSLAIPRGECFDMLGPKWCKENLVYYYGNYTFLWDFIIV